VQRALETFTVNGAWAIRREDRLGRISPRFLADFAGLAHNPLRVDVCDIAAIPVLGTVVDGRPWWA
jgi:predicted amidohydrolase YtcJ